MTRLNADNLRLSARERNALNAIGIHTIEELLTFDVERVRKIKGYGQGTIDKLKKTIKRIAAREAKNTDENPKESNRFNSEFVRFLSAALSWGDRSTPWSASYLGEPDMFAHVSRLLNIPASYPAKSVLACTLPIMLNLNELAVYKLFNDSADTPLGNIIEKKDIETLAR
jgi:hypothetical protein